MRSPRKRYHMELPDPPPAGISASAAHLALLVVAVNVVACLIAGRALTVAERERSLQLAAQSSTIARPAPVPPDDRPSAARLAPFTAPWR